MLCLTVTRKLDERADGLHAVILAQFLEWSVPEDLVPEVVVPKDIRDMTPWHLPHPERALAGQRWVVKVSRFRHARSTRYR